MKKSTIKRLSEGEKIKADLPGNIYLKQYMQEFSDSEGEEYLTWYFEKEEIKFIREVEIYGLKNDSLTHRRADFYLPKYNVFVEFNGAYNKSKDDRLRYSKKSKVYRDNGIPCLDIYPDNIGAIDFYFETRLEKVLREHGMKKEYILFELRSLVKENSVYFLILIGVVFLWIVYIDPSIGIAFFLMCTLVTLLWTIGMFLSAYNSVRTIFELLFTKDYFKKDDTN